MIFAVERVGDAAIVKADMPRLDAMSAERFKDSLKMIYDGGDRHIIIDFSEVRFMDSSGLGALVGALKYMGAGSAIEIACPTDTVVKILRLTRMNKVFKIRDTLPVS